MNKSLWQTSTTPKSQYTELANDLAVDILIIGGGITGLTTALQLIDSHKKIAVVESDYFGSGTTGNSTGNLYIPVQPYFQNIVAKFDHETAQQVATSRLHALNYIEQTIQDFHIHCALAKRPWYLYTNDKSKEDFLHKEVETLQSLHLPIEYTDNLPYSLKFTKAAMLPNQARFNPFLYVQALATILAERGCLLYENTRILNQLEIEEGFLFHTDKAEIKAKCVVAATHTPLGINRIQMFTSPYRSYVVAAELKSNYYPEMQCWDLREPHHVICTHSENSDQANRLLISGSHHKTGQSDDMESHYQELEKFLHENFEDAHVIKRWSAQHYHSVDTLPYIGSINSAKNYYIATGYFADGLIYGTIAGIIIATEILGKENPWHKIYDPHRFVLGSIPELVTENTNVACQYAKDMPILHSADAHDIKKGEAKVVEINREKVAVYRDEEDKLHAVCAVCPHMKCIVNWNDAEKTWDCPCHGSRFTITGKVIEGPALTHLKTKKI